MSSTPPVLPALDDERETKLFESALSFVNAIDEVEKLPFGKRDAALSRESRACDEFRLCCQPRLILALLSELPSLRASQEEGARDTARLDWLDARREDITRVVGHQVSEDEWSPEPELTGYRWHGIEGQCETVREAIDRAASLPSVEVGND